MANYSQLRLLFSLRQPLHFYHKLNPSILRSSSHSIHHIHPNFRSSSSSSFFSTFQSTTHSNALQLLRNPTFNGVRSFATRLSQSSSSSSSSSNRPPKDAIMLEGCDFEHWLVVVEPPDPQLTRDEIIDGYIKTLAQVLKSEEEARMKIYSVSTRHYYAFSAILSEELGYKLKELPNVRWVLPDSYMDVKNKTYAGEPFINGQAVPYDPKYHEIWVRNNEESQRNNYRSRRRQSDPNSRSRSPTSTSARSSSNQNWMSASGPQQHQVSHTSSSQNQSFQRSSISDPVRQQQNLTRLDDTPNQVAQPSHTQNPSRMQYQAPPTFPQNQQSPLPFAQNQQNPPPFSQNQQNPPPFSQNQQNPPPFSQNRQNPPPFSQNQQNPPPFSQNQQNLPPFSQNQQNPPLISQNPNSPPFSQNQNPPPFSHNQPPQPPHLQNQSMPWTRPPSQPPATISNSQDWGSHNHSWAPPGGHENQARHPSHMQNQTPSMSSTMNPYNPARNVQNESWGTTTMYQGQPPQPPISNNNFSYNNMPPPASSTNVPYQGQSWVPASNYQSQSSPPPNSSDFPNGNVPHSASASGMPMHTQNPNFHRGNVPSQVQQNGYPYRDIPHNTRSGSSLNGYPSQPSQQQQYQDSNNAYRDMQSSTSVATPPNVPNHQNPPKWGVSGEVQLNTNYRNVPHREQNGRAHTNYPPEPPHPSQYQQYQNNSSPQSWNYQSVNPPIQNSISPNMSMSPGVHSPQFQGRDMPRPLQNNEFQHKMGTTAENVRYNGERMPNDTNVETVQARDYQERDIPIDSYMYASK